MAMFKGRRRKLLFEVVIRDEASIWCWSFTSQVTKVSIPKAELEAVCCGLHLACDKGIHELICHSDAQLAISLIQ